MLKSRKIFSKSHIAVIAERLRRGEIAVIPTDTVYGLACDAARASLIQRVGYIKGREGKLGTFIGSSVEQLHGLGVDLEGLETIKYLWPNSISVILPIKSELATSVRTETIACRIPKDDFLLSILELTGPLYTTSANSTGMEPATSIDEAMGYFSDKVDFYVDGGDLDGRLPSTIVNALKIDRAVIREGAVSRDEIDKLFRANLNNPKT